MEKFVIGLDLKGLMVNIDHIFKSYEEAESYLKKHVMHYIDSSVHIMVLEEGQVVHAYKYQFQIDTYYICELGAYSEEKYNELDGGFGVIEIGQTVHVYYDLLPKELQEDCDLVEEAIQKWYWSSNSVKKPDWILN